jgi:hypothetical protein
VVLAKAGRSRVCKPDVHPDTAGAFYARADHAKSFKPGGMAENEIVAAVRAMGTWRPNACIGERGDCTHADTSGKLVPEFSRISQPVY